MALVEMWDHGVGWHLGQLPPTDVAILLLLHQDAWCRCFTWSGILKVAGTAAASITSEHEEDTLGQPDVHRSDRPRDRLGQACRRPGARETACRGDHRSWPCWASAWGSLHVLSLPALIVALAVFTAGSPPALGLWVSLQLRSTWRAQFLTIAMLLLDQHHGPSGAQLRHPVRFHPPALAGLHSHEVNQLAFDRGFVHILAATGWPHSWHIRDIDSGIAWQTIFSVLSLLSYATLATLLTWDSLRRFEIAAGRARRSLNPAQTVCAGSRRQDGDRLPVRATFISGHDRVIETAQI